MQKNRLAFYEICFAKAGAKHRLVGFFFLKLNTQPQN